MHQPAPSRRVMYFQPPPLYAADSFYVPANGHHITIQTDRDRTAFYEALHAAFGAPTDTTDAGIRWHQQRLFGHANASLYVLGSTDIDLLLQGETVPTDRVDSAFYTFFDRLFREKIRTAPLIPATPSPWQATPDYDMHELLAFDTDSMAHCFDTFVSDTLFMFSIHWLVNEKGQWQWHGDSMQEYPPALRARVEAMLQKTPFPLLLHRDSGDTLAYTVQWEQVFSANTLKEYYLRQIHADLARGQVRWRQEAIPEATWPYQWGQWFDRARTHLYLCLPDPFSTVYLFEIQNNTLREIQSVEHGLWGTTTDIRDLNADGIPELTIWSGANMNGNSWNLVLAYDPAAGRLEKAGSFSTEYTIDSLQRRVFEEYSGSWYMPQTRTLYAWNGRRLLPVKQARIELLDGFMGSESMFFYLENPQFQQGIDSLQERERGIYRENTRQKRLWESIFEGKPEH